MDIDAYPLQISSTPTAFYGCGFSCGMTIRAYSVSAILPGDFHPQTLTESMRFYRPLPYPYTWFVFGGELAIVNINDLQAFEETHQYPPSFVEYHSQQQQQQQQEAIDDVIAVLQDLNMVRGIMNESFQQASEFVACSGLTEKQISKNLRVTKYRQEGEEEGEICVVCQAEFEKNEKIGVLQCKHRFHPECIKEWLLRKNVCPLCKHQGLNV